MSVVALSLLPGLVCWLPHYATQCRSFFTVPVVWQALRHYDRAIELDPKNKEALCNKAASLLKLKEWQEAAAAAEQVSRGMQSCLLGAP